MATGITRRPGRGRLERADTQLPQIEVIGAPTAGFDQVVALVDAMTITPAWASTFASSVVFHVKSSLECRLASTSVVETPGTAFDRQTRPP